MAGLAPHGRARIDRMMLENNLPKQRLATPRDRPHTVKRHALTDDGKGISRKVPVRNGIDKKATVLITARCNNIGKRMTRLTRAKLELVGPDTFDQLVNKDKGVLNPFELIFHRLENRRGRNTRLRKPTIQELFPGSRARRDRLGNELVKVQNLNAVFTQKLGKSVVLLLRRRKIRDVIEQQTSHTVRREIEKLPARSMEHDFFQPADLGPDM